jgi:hypothetical protein
VTVTLRSPQGVKEGRGRYCHIDYYLRHSPDRHCLFAYAGKLLSHKTARSRASDDRRRQATQSFHRSKTECLGMSPRKLWRRFGVG